jgi:hypothetical protein
VYDEETIGKLLGRIAAGDDCTVEQALQRALTLYMAVQMTVWGRGCVLGVIDSDFKVLGILASGPIEEDETDDPNFEIDLD